MSGAARFVIVLLGGGPKHAVLCAVCSCGAPSNIWRKCQISLKSGVISGLDWYLAILPD